MSKLIVLKQFKHTTIRYEMSKLEEKVGASDRYSFIDELRMVEVENEYFLI